LFFIFIFESRDRKLEWVVCDFDKEREREEREVGLGIGNIEF